MCGVGPPSVGVLAGLAVGVGMGLLLVQVLEPLFILPPTPVTPLGDAALLVLAATAASGVVAMVILPRLSPAEVLREH